MLLINCEVSLILTWSRECVVTSIERRVIKNTRRDTSPTNATFQITDTKLDVPVVTLSIENDERLQPFLVVKNYFNTNDQLIIQSSSS